MKKCSKCGKLYSDTEKKCTICGTLLPTGGDDSERYRKFAELLQNHKFRKFETVRTVACVLIVMIGLCYLFSPLVVYSNGITNSKTQSYSIMNLCLGSGKSDKLSETGGWLIFLYGAIIAGGGFLLSFLPCYQYDFSCKRSFLRKRFDGVNLQKMHRKRYGFALLSLLVGYIGWFVAGISLFSLPESFAEAMRAANSYYWKQSVDGWALGWGGIVTLGLLILLGALGLALFFVTIETERKYVKGKCTDEEVIKIFQGSKLPSNAVKSTSEQLRELDQLKKDGLISADDYEKKKKQILNL